MFLYGVKSGFNLSVLCPPHVISEFLFFWWLCWRWLVYFWSWNDHFLLGWAACKQGPAHAYRCAKTNPEEGAACLCLAGGRCEWPFSSIIPLFPPWCVVSPQIWFQTLRGSAQDFTGLASEQEAAWAWSPLFAFMMGLGCIRSWDKPLKIFSRSETCISGCLIWKHNENLAVIPWWEWLLWDFGSQWQARALLPILLGLWLVLWPLHYPFMSTWN